MECHTGNNGLYIKNKKCYESLVCESYKKSAHLCGSVNDPHITVSCSSSYDANSTDYSIVKTADKNYTHCPPIYSNVEKNNANTFERLKRTLSSSLTGYKYNAVLIADAVGVNDLYGVHDTKRLWKWIAEYIDSFIDAGINVIALEFVNENAFFIPLDLSFESNSNKKNKMNKTNKTNKTLISTGKSSNVSPDDVSILREIIKNDRIKIVGIDSKNGYRGMLESVRELSKLASPNNKIGFILGSGYAAEICSSIHYHAFPKWLYEINTLKQDLENDTELHFIELMCSDIDTDI